MGSHDHKEMAAKVGSVRAAVITVSDSRDKKTDESGEIIKSLLKEDDHIIAYYNLLPNDRQVINMELNTVLSGSGAQVVIFTGGTGISSKDVTFDTVVPRFEKTLDGFGELFRYLSYEEIGSAAIMSRAAAGTIDGRLIVCLPGSRGAVKTALRKLLIPELRHLVWELSR